MNSRDYVLSFVTSENQGSGFVVSKTGRRHLPNNRRILYYFPTSCQTNYSLMSVNK